MFQIGLIINPLAGIGGATGLKGSDGTDTARQALAKGATPQAQLRASQALRVLQAHADQVHFFTWGNGMGADVLQDLGFSHTELGQPGQPSVAEDTHQAVTALLQHPIDLLVFAGGDGTARDVLDELPDHIPALGIPAGVKMQSGVYAISPQAAGELLAQLVTGSLVDLRACEVRDIDEAALRDGKVVSRFYGEMLVPAEGRFVQHVKMGGVESEELVLQDIAADLAEDMEDDVLYIIGPGTTTTALAQELNLELTLLGVDVLVAGEILATDADEKTILACLDNHDGPVRIVLTATGGQGFLLGRGNQQISPSVLRRAGKDALVIIATKSKIKALDGRPLWVDTGDAGLDQQLAGYHSIITGYRDRILYPISHGGDPGGQGET